MKKCCIVIPTHKEKLSGNEERSFLRALEIFKNKDIKLIIPNNISTEYFDAYKKQYNFEIISVSKEWQRNYKAYNKMCCNKNFYKLFKNYEYILIYQTDCWVFEDRIDEFIKLGYDWYGAPWPHHHDSVGNGGLSLRKVSKMIEITSENKFNGDSVEGAEDTWFCQNKGNELNICDLENACNFSMENITSRYLQKIKTIPMGLHGKFTMNLWDENGNKFLALK